MRIPEVRSGGGDGRALYLVGLTVMLVTFLVALSAILARVTRKPVTPNDRGGGLVHMIPGAPSPVQPVGTFPDGPGYTVVEDIRDTLKRLPDRNTPKGWSNPSVKPRKPG